MGKVSAVPPKPSRGSYLTRALHTARISNVESVLYVNRMREVVNFMLGSEIENDALCIVTSVVQSCYFSRVIKLFRIHKLPF